jgi:hypothetical protein
MRVNKRENWPYLKFPKPLDFKAVPGDPDTFDIKNVRYVALVGGVEFDEFADQEITLTGTFKPRTTVPQPGPLFFNTSDFPNAAPKDPSQARSLDKMFFSGARLGMNILDAHLGRLSTRTTRRGRRRAARQSHASY